MRRNTLIALVVAIAVAVVTSAAVGIGLARTAGKAVVTGTVLTAGDQPLGGVTVELRDHRGAVRAHAVTDDLGSFRLDTVQGDQRIVIGSGSVPRSNASLPDRFRWSGPLEVDSDVSLPVSLPTGRAVTVVATDGTGRPLTAAQVGTAAGQRVTDAVLWRGGPELAGRQQVRTGPAATDPTGRATVWSFPARRLEAYVEAPSAAGDAARMSITLPVTRDATVAAMPGRGDCTRPVTDLGTGPARLVADLEATPVRESASKAPLLARADEIVDGRIRAVRYNADRTGDVKRYLYDEGVALRRITGVLAYAYAATKDPKYLDTMATSVALNAAAWPDWNPGHPLDSAQVATAVALAYGWSGGRMTPEQRAAVSDALVSRMVLPYSCRDGVFTAARTAKGNQNTVIASAAVLAGLAVRNDSGGWAAAAVEDGAAALARVRHPDGRGRSLASGPTVEGLMYTTYEAASLALVHATARLAVDDAPVSTALQGRLADLATLAEWTERCGTVADPPVEDGWDYYPWVDRTTALAELAGSPGAGSRVLQLLDGLQAVDSLLVPDQPHEQVPDGIAELLASRLPSAAPAEAAPAKQSYAPAEGQDGSYWGCASDGGLRALVAATPNDAPHGHDDVGNLVVTAGGRTVLTDLGQRDYNERATYPWRGLTKAHSTVGLREPDGRVSQVGTGWGSVSATADGLAMVSASALDGIDWRRDVALTGTAVSVRDQLQQRDSGRGTTPLSMSFLLAVREKDVIDLGDGRLRFALGDGSTWELAAPAGVPVTFSDARPTLPYADSDEFDTTLGARHTLVTLTADLADRLDLTTTVTRVGP